MDAFFDEHLMLGATHQPATIGKGAPKGGAEGEALGRSRAGLTTKDPFARRRAWPVATLSAHESRTADGIEDDAIIAGKAYDSNTILAHVKVAGVKAVIASNSVAKDAFGATKAL